MPFFVAEPSKYLGFGLSEHPPCTLEKPPPLRGDGDLAGPTVGCRGSPLSQTGMLEVIDQRNHRAPIDPQS
jgi:hypothetical protein